MALAEEFNVNLESISEDFFKDFYYELLRCKEIALRTRSLDRDLESGGLDQQLDDSKKDEENSEESAAADQEEPLLEENQDNVANTNQSPWAVHDLLKKGIPVHAVKALDEIQKRLKNLLASQSMKVLQLFQDDLSTFKESQYAMVALADEIFLNLNWQGRFAWQNALLEGQLFHSQSAGESVFQKIEDLLSRYDGSKIGLARIYFFLLSLGFRGKFSDFKETEVLNSYKKRLYAFIYGTNPSLSKYGTIPLVFQCYEHTQVAQHTPKLPDLQFWGQLLVGFLLVYLLISYIIWYDLAKDLYHSLNYLFEHFSFFLSKNV